MRLIRTGTVLDMFEIDHENYVLRTHDSKHYGNIYWKMFKGVLNHGEWRFNAVFNSKGLNIKDIRFYARELEDFMRWLENNVKHDRPINYHRFPPAADYISDFNALDGDKIRKIIEDADKSLAPEGMEMDHKTGSAIHVGTGGDPDKIDWVEDQFMAGTHSPFGPVPKKKQLKFDHRKVNIKKI